MSRVHVLGASLMAVGGAVMAWALVRAGDARAAVLATLDPNAFSLMQQAWLVVGMGAVLVLAGTLVLQLAGPRGPSGAALDERDEREAQVPTSP